MAIADQLATFASDTLGGTYGNPPPVLVRNQGTYQGQCVSFIRQWLAVINLPNQRVGDAAVYWKSAYMEQYFDEVTDGSHQDGDILIWGKGSMTTTAGHIAIWFNGKLLNQNWGNSLKVSLNEFFSQGYLGSYRIKGENMTKDEAYKIVKWDYLHGTGVDPTSPQAESWANAIVGNPAKIDELGSFMNDQINQRIQAAYAKGKAEAGQSDADTKLQSIREALGIK